MISSWRAVLGTSLCTAHSWDDVRTAVLDEYTSILGGDKEPMLDSILLQRTSSERMDMMNDDVADAAWRTQARALAAKPLNNEEQ